MRTRRPSTPSRLSLSAALDVLDVHRSDLARTEEQLSEFAHPAQLLEIVDHFFPDEFPRDRAAIRRSPSGQFRELETRLGDLVHYGMFPINEYAFDIYADDDYSSEPLAQIPLVHFFNPNDDDLGEAIGEWPSGLALAAALAHFGDYGEILLERAGLDDEMRANLGIVPCAHVLGAALRALCRRERSPLRHLYCAVCAVTESTGTVYFDGECTCGNCSTVDWSVESVGELARQHGVVSAVFDQVRELTEWLDADYPARAAEAVRLWNRAARRSPHDDQA